MQIRNLTSLIRTIDDLDIPIIDVTHNQREELLCLFGRCFWESVCTNIGNDLHDIAQNLNVLDLFSGNKVHLLSLTQNKTVRAKGDVPIADLSGHSLRKKRI